MIVNMLGVDVRCYDRHRIVTEHLSDESFTYLVCDLRCDVFGIGKAHYVMNCFDRPFTAFWRRCIESVFGELIVNSGHGGVRELGLGHAVDRSRQQEVICLVGVQYVPQSFFDVSVDSH